MDCPCCGYKLRPGNFSNPKSKEEKRAADQLKKKDVLPTKRAKVFRNHFSAI
ncbi:MAG TPA: hypothetical protein VE619_03855 [Nitrososphaeraceae archaeon]|nr:hypothetical protein [Nitrososphaeraceae archaeon]